jgi:hypothetical protein
MNIREATLPGQPNPTPIFWQPVQQQPANFNEPLWDDDYQADEGDEDEDDLFDEPALQQLTQNWGTSESPRSYSQPPARRLAHSFPPSNRPIAQVQHQPAHNQPAPAQQPTAQPTTPAAPANTAQPAAVTPRNAPSGGARLNLPPRPEGALTGKQFLESTKNMSRPQREAAILSEIQKGNVPEFARQMKEIQLQNNGHTGTLRVMPDYLAIGSDQDFVRIPMDAKTAQKIADQTGTSLPTTKMVDDIYKQADTKLTPQPLPAGAQMMSNDYTGRHNDLIAQQMGQRGAQLGELTAGHQKDLVISNRLTQHPDRVAIYGWHQQNGRPIQGLSTVHESSYSDYSHGVRLVGGTMLVDGQERPLTEVLNDPQLAGLVSNEGVIRDPRVPGI